MALTGLAVAALAMLVERPMHPYEMFQTMVARGEDSIVKVRPGSLYHAVDRLADAGLVRATGTERAGNRPERTTYEVTDEGRAAFADWVREGLRVPAEEFPRFPHAIGEAHILPREEVAALLSVRIAKLEADRQFLRSVIGQTAAAGKEERLLLDLPYREAVLTAEIAWLTELVSRLRTGDIAW